MTKLSVIQADITTLTVDAIVNAANNSLLGGGGVDGAIHRAAGKELKAFCRTLNGCKTGEAKITPGFNLPARFVIHTVGPEWRGGFERETELLENCYKNTLTLAVENGVQRIAFPAISTGVYGYPIDQATKVAVRTVAKFCNQHPQISEVVFCCFSHFDVQVYKRFITIAQEEWLGPVLNLNDKC